VVSALTWLTADLLWDHAHGLVPYWNALVRLGFFLIVTFALSSLRESRDRQAELTHFIVHDLRSPLTNVMAGLELASSEGPGKMEAETQRELLEIAAVSGQQLMRLINSILDISRMEGGQMPLQTQEVLVEDLTNSALQQVALWAKQAGILTAVDIDSAARSVYADPSITTRVLGNLLSNAMRYSPSQSTVTIRARPASHAMVAVSVVDQGPGIPKEWVGKVFDKFAQVRARKSGAAVGSGLGLTFAKAAVEAQGGRIWIESEEGKGTTVTFTLPAAGNAHHA
jgi:signal transduction histidine kinase